MLNILLAKLIFKCFTVKKQLGEIVKLTVFSYYREVFRIVSVIKLTAYH